MAMDDYAKHDALGLAALVRRGEVTPAELLDEALGRTERLNGRLNAVVHSMAEAARQRARETLPDGPFRGVPFLLKDLHVSYPGTPSTDGSRLHRQRFPKERSTLVVRQEAAGLVLFGKTNTPEFGIIPMTESELFGTTRNPWRLDVTAGGSSGGAAAAVAAGIVPMAHASDGGGSIRIPASCCGLYGLKPTRGRTPMGPERLEGARGFSAQHAVTRSVRDSAALLDATAGPDRVHLGDAPPPRGPFSADLDADPEPLRVAFTASPFTPAEPHPDVVAAVEDAARLLEDLGHHVEEARPAIDPEPFAQAFLVHWATALAGGLDEAGRARGRAVTPDDVERRTWLLNLLGRSVSAVELHAERRTLHDVIKTLFAFHERYDVLLTPTLGQPPLPHGSLDAKGLQGALQNWVGRLRAPALTRLPGLLEQASRRAFFFAPFTMPFNVSGQPSASVPLHWNEDGLPIGVMLTAAYGEEHLLLRLSAQLERARPWADRRPPTA